MPNKKKKVSSCYQKQNEAHYKNLFLKKVLEIAKAVSKDDAYKLLTAKMLDSIYHLRFRTLRVVADENIDISSKDIQDIRDSILAYIRRKSFVIEDTGYEICVYVFLGPGISLWHHLKYLTTDKADVYPEIVKAFGEFVETEDLFNDAMKIVSSITNFISWDLTSFDKRLISIEITAKASETDSSCIYFEAKVKGYKPETINVTFDGNNRPAFRLGITSNGSKVVWIDLDASSLSLQHDPESKIPVYIQHHAMNRLAERLDCVDRGMQLINLIYSVDNPKCIEYKGKKLLEFNYFDKKIGYLVIELIHGIAFIRTFLLLTHSNTPEGDALHNMIGLEKHDISYLNLDKLSTFVLSDVCKNQTLRDLFSRAGCMPLFEAEKHHYDKECIVAKASTIESFIYKFQEHAKYLELPELAQA